MSVEGANPKVHMVVAALTVWTAMIELSPVGKHPGSNISCPAHASNEDLHCLPPPLPRHAGEPQAVAPCAELR
jgi:hypothetical protein